jgi:hypothetical protein
MAIGGKRLLVVVAKTLYWLLLAAALALFPVLQSWDALPEGGVWAATKLLILGLVAGVGLAPRRRTAWHATAVLIMLAAGALLFALNQGLIPQRPGEADVRILRRAAELLSTPEAWDRSNSRDCSATSTTLTLYCALRRASIEETGGFRHRQPALQIVRVEIEKLRPQADYDHRVAGFNSDSTVTFADLRRLLESSVARAESGLGGK